MIDEARQSYQFDEFRLDVRKRQLTRNGEVVPLYSKAFDLLLVMARNNGRDLTKDELLEAVWPGQTLEEANLTVNMSAVRKALGEKAAQPHYIINIPGRGYRFVADLATAERPDGIVIETQTVSQITIEQETENHNEALKAGTAPALLTTRRHLLRWPLILGALGFAVLAVAVGSVFVVRRIRSGRTVAARFQQIKLRQLTNDGGVVVAAISPDGKFFASVHTEKISGRQSLRLGQTNGEPSIELRPFAEVLYREVEFSPDGSTVYYTMNENGPNSPYHLVSVHSPTLYRLPVLGGVPVKVRDDLGSFFAISPEGRRLAYVKLSAANQNTSVLISDINGADERAVLTRPAKLNLNSLSLSWSPDGSMLALSGRPEDDSSGAALLLLEVATGKLMTLSDSRWRDVGGVAWLKDGSGVLIMAARAGSEEDRQIWLMSYPGGEVRKITNDLLNYGNALSVTADSDHLLTAQFQQVTNVWVGPANDLLKAKQVTFGVSNRGDGLYGIDWTPDGRILYTSVIGKNQTIWIMNADGSNARQLTPAGSTATVPSVTADGRFVVFESDRSGASEIWRVNVDGSGLKQLTTCGKNSEPDVTPDGKWVVYKSNCVASAVWRIPIEGGEPKQLTDKPCSWPWVSPDSQWIACAYWIDATKYKLAVVSINGGEPKQILDIAPQANFRYGIKWTPDGKAITYRDWVAGIWRQPIDGSPPQRLPGLPEEKIFANGWSRDGKLFAFVRGITPRDVVLISSER